MAAKVVPYTSSQIDNPLLMDDNEPYVIESPLLTPAKHAHFNGCDMYKDGREAPSITGVKLFKDAVKRLVEREDGRSDFRFDYPTLGKLEDDVLEKGLKAEKISIIHSPGVDLFPSSYLYANHDSGYKPQSISPDIISILLPSSTADPGTRANSTSGAVIVPWFNGYIDLSPIGYEGITVGYTYNKGNKSIQIKINIRNNNGTITTIDSTRNYSDFKQTSHGIDYLRAGNTVKNKAILTAIIEEIIKYLIGKALGDTLQAVELQLATQLNSEYTNQNTCGFTTDRVLTSRYKALNQTICLQVGKESGLKQVLLFRAGGENDMKQQIKLTHKTNAIKNNNNVIFVINQAFLYGDINVSGTTVALNEPIRIVFNTIVKHIEKINEYLEATINIDNNQENADVIRKKCAQCTASHIFKPKSNKLINIKEIFDDLSTLDQGLAPFSLKDMFVGFTTGTFSQYVYSLRMGIKGGGGKRDKKPKTSRLSSRIFNMFKSRKQRTKEEMTELFLEAIRGEQSATDRFIDQQMYLIDFSQEFLTTIEWYSNEINELKGVDLRLPGHRQAITTIFQEYFRSLNITNEETIDKLRVLIPRLVDNYIWYREIGIEKRIPKHVIDDPFDEYGDSYCLIRLIIYSIITLLFKRDSRIYNIVWDTITGKDLEPSGGTQNHQLEKVISSNFIEPIYYILYRRFQYAGYALFEFEFIQNFVLLYITDEPNFFNIGVLSAAVSEEYIFNEETDVYYDNVFRIVENAKQMVARNSTPGYGYNSNSDKRKVFNKLYDMARDIKTYFYEISMSEKDPYFENVAPVVESASSSNGSIFTSLITKTPPKKPPNSVTFINEYSQQHGSQQYESQPEEHNSKTDARKISLPSIREEFSGGSKKRYNKKNKTKKQYQKINKKTRKGNKNHRKTYKK